MQPLRELVRGVGSSAATAADNMHELPAPRQQQLPSLRHQPAHLTVLLGRKADGRRRRRRSGRWRRGRRGPRRFGGPGRLGRPRWGRSRGSRGLRGGRERRRKRRVRGRYWWRSSWRLEGCLPWQRLWQWSRCQGRQCSAGCELGDRRTKWSVRPARHIRPGVGSTHN